MNEFKIKQKCIFCGKEFESYKSRPRKYCSLDCAYRNRIKPVYVSDSEYEYYYNKHLGMLKVLAGKYKKEYFDEMLQEARIVLWQVLGRANRNLIKGKLSTYLYKAVKNELMTYWRRKIKNKFYQIYENEQLEDREKFYKLYTEPNRDAQIDCQSALGNILKSSKNTYVRSKKMLFELVYNDNTFEQIASKYNCTIRDVSANIYNAKKMLRNEFSEEYKLVRL